MRIRGPVTLLAVGTLVGAAALSQQSASASEPPRLAPARYAITDLGVLPGGTESNATGLNNAGTVVGFADGGANVRGFRWSAGTFTPLPGLPGGGYSRANAINDANQVAGMATRSGGGFGYPVRWSAAGVIQDLGGPIQNQLGGANAIDRLGQVAGGQRPRSSQGSPEGMLYDPAGEPTDLNKGRDEEEWRLGEARGMNNRGQIVGGPGYVWRGGAVTALPQLPGQAQGSTLANAINVRGDVVGAASTPTSLRPVIWRGGTITELGTVAGIQYSQATAINAAGDVVGTADPLCSPCAPARAWRWRDGVLTPLDELIAPGSGWSLRSATGINDRGQIVGTGLLDGRTRGYLLTPPVHVNVNFAPAAAAVPAGYAADTGAVYGARGNGLTYGWDTDNSAFSRDRDAASSPDQRYDTLTHLQKPGSARTWEVAVPNGRYQVHLVAGDPRAFDSTFRLQVERVAALSGKPSAGSPWVEATVTVTVMDGRLTVGNAPGSSNDKLSYIDIVAV